MAGTLHDAALTGDVESVREALARGEDVNGVSADGETALHVACTYAHDECVAALLAAGARTDAPDATGTTPLHLTCLLGHASTLRLLAVPAAGHLNLRGADGGTPLHVCATYGHSEAAEVMLASGADVCATDGAGSTALHAAVGGSHVPVAAALLAHARARGESLLGALRDAFDGSGQTALHAAAVVGTAKGAALVNLLLQHAARVNTPDADTANTPLHRAAAAGCDDALQALLGAGADANAKDAQGGSPLLAAAASGSAKCVAALLAAGSNPRAVSRTSGATPLHAAARAASCACITALLAAGGDPTARDAAGRAPVDVAGSEDAAALLRRAAATQAAAGNGAVPAPGSGPRAGASSSSGAMTDVKAAAKAKAAAVVAASAAKAAAKIAAATATQPPWGGGIGSPAAQSPSNPSPRAETPQSPHRGAPQRSSGAGSGPVTSGRGGVAGSPRNSAPSAPVIPDSPLARASGLVRADGDAPDGADGEGQAQAALTSATATASHCDAAVAAAAERAAAASLQARALLDEHAALRDAADAANQRAAAAALEAKQAVKAAADVKAQADAAAAAAAQAEEECLDARRAAERAHRAKRRAEQELATLAQQREAAARARQQAAEEEVQQQKLQQQAAEAAAKATLSAVVEPHHTAADDVLKAHPLTDMDGPSSGDEDEDDDAESAAELARLEAAMAVEEARLQALRQEMAAKQRAQASKRSQRSPGEVLDGGHGYGGTPNGEGRSTSASVANTPPAGAPATPPAPAVSAAEQAAFEAGAAQRAEGIAQAERVYQSAVEAAELLAQQCEDSHELREQELQQLAQSGDTPAYQAASVLHAARVSTDAARRRQAAAAIASAAAELSALRREDADAAAQFSQRVGTGHTSQARQSQSGSLGPAGVSGGSTPRSPVTSMSPRVLHAQLARSVADGVTFQPAAPTPVAVAARSGYGHDTLSRTAEWAFAAAAVAQSSREGGVAAPPADGEQEASEYGDAISPPLEEAADHPDGAYHAQQTGPAAAASASAEEEEDPWMSAEVQHRQALRQQAASAAAAAAEAAQQVAYLAAGPGSRGDVDMEEAWQVAAQLARGDVPEEHLPAALSCCIKALLGPQPASRAGAWGLHEALAQEVPRELVYLRGLTLLRPLADTVTCIRAHPSSADWFAAHFSGAAVEALTGGDLSCKYFVDNCLTEIDSLAEADVFFDPGPRGVFQLPEDSDLVPGGPRPRPDGPRSNSSGGGPHATLLLVAGDPDLNALVQAAVATQPRLGYGRQDSPEGVRARLSALAQWVCIRMGGPASEDRIHKAQHHLALLASQGGPQGYVPLAKVTQGLAAPRALLFKYLCDRLFPHQLVRCRLVRAPASLAPDGNHVWNVVTVEEPDESGGEVREVQLLVDLMRERNSGALEPRLVDERSPFAAQYKATAGFSAPRYIALPGRVPPPQYAGQIVRARTLPPGTFGRAFVARCRDGTGADGVPVPPDALFTVKEFTPLLAPGTSSAGAQHAALVELSTLKACRHPHVAPVRALFVAGDIWLLVTNFALGGSWDAALKALPAARIERHEILMRFALETAAGMAYLHARRVAHCDLKPSNLLVTPGGGVAVTDYGLFHLLPPDAQASRAAHWSAAYMAPEARAVLLGGGGGELTPLADVWSFGVCLGTALMRGDYPAPPPTQAPYPLPALGACDAPEALMAIYRLCVQPQPQARPRFDALVAELERAAKALCAGQEG